MNYYIYAEDLVSALVGPFATAEEANAHLEYCERRGDSATHTIVDETTAKLVYSNPGLRLTLEMDRSITCDICANRIASGESGGTFDFGFWESVDSIEPEFHSTSDLFQTCASCAGQVSQFAFQLRSLYQQIRREAK